MNRDDIRKRLQDHLIEITDNDGLVLTDATAPEGAPGWDSVNHIKLVFAIEADLGIAFDPAEMVLPRTVGALLDRIEGKL